MAKPTIASLQAEVDSLRGMKALWETRLVQFYEDCDEGYDRIDKGSLETLLDTLGIDYTGEFDFNLTVQVSGTIKGKRSDLADLWDFPDVLIGNEVVACHKFGVEGYDVSGVSIEVADWSIDV